MKAAGAMRWLRYLLVVIVLGAVAFALRSIAWGQVWTTLRNANLALVILVTLLNAPHLFVKSERWRVLLRPFAKISPWRLFHYLVVSYAASVALPARAGELVRLYVLRRRHDVPVPASIGLIAVEKILEVVGLLFVLGPLPFLGVLPAGMERAIAVVTGVLLVVIITLVIAVRYGRGRDNLPAMFATLAEGLACIRSADALISAIALSIAAWLIDALKVWLLLTAFGIEVPWVAPFVVLLTLNLAIVLPSMPGNVGTFEAGAIVGLAAFGISRERALAFAIVHHVLQVVPILIAGFSGLSLVDEAKQVKLESAALET